MGLPSLPITDEFSLIWRHDTALDQTRENFENAYRVAVETLDWPAIVTPGEQPTVFRFRLVSQALLRLLADAASIGTLQSYELVFRMALVRIDNAPAGCPDVKRKVDRDVPKLGEMAQREVVDFLDRATAAYSLASGEDKGSLVLELGRYVTNRCSGVSPKS